ncbi:MULTISPECIES: peptidase T [Megasphaera]|uniref:Peptidase T n=1 Tax=Megasphaera vaginalis (ex Srinivasan et al. 2021) TaxID=1111454 RepID=U7UT40_9FIRM|nr:MULTISPECIES: peptidase T [Megasphaera]ERT62500.1 peptidase T [Megasphaera vaginalis (ex Srinivasan et al. 2021)]
MNSIENRLRNRFWKYVQIPSQSKFNGGSKVPSTASQWDMVKTLRDECASLGVVDLEISPYGVLTGKLPANVPDGSAAVIPAVGFCAHVDTVDVDLSPLVRPKLTETYDGKDIVLNQDAHIVMKVEEHPELLPYVGQDIITSDGTSVLGADNKAAIANIMTALETLSADRTIYHGDIYVAFVPDEECGLFGSKNMDYEKFPVDFAYTIDSCEVGEVVYETFNAGSAEVTIYGVSAHPMSAKGVLVNPTLLACDFVNMFDRRETPECTEGKEGYIWCQQIESNQSKAVVHLNIRDHHKDKYEEKKERILRHVETLRSREPRATVECVISDTYGNIADAVTDENHKAIDYIYAAMKELHITPKTIAMRGGTDGSFISTKGILTPNYFTGALNFHSKYEFLPVQSLKKSYDMTMKLIELIYQGA